MSTHFTPFCRRVLYDHPPSGSQSRGRVWGTLSPEGDDRHYGGGDLSGCFVMEVSIVGEEKGTLDELSSKLPAALIIPHLHSHLTLAPTPAFTSSSSQISMHTLVVPHLCLRCDGRVGPRLRLHHRHKVWMSGVDVGHSLVSAASRYIEDDSHISSHLR